MLAGARTITGYQAKTVPFPVPQRTRESRCPLTDRIAAAPIKRRARKEHLYFDGDSKTHVYMIEAGTVLVYKILPDAKRQIVDIAFPGDLIGLGARGAHTFNAQAAEATRVRCLAVGQLHELAQRDASVAMKLYDAIATELDATRNHLLSIGYRDATSRVASFLRAVAQRNERRGCDATEFVLTIRRADIADFLGLTIETVSRSFSKLKADGVIDLDHGGYVQILDPLALENAAHGRSRPRPPA